MIEARIGDLLDCGSVIRCHQVNCRGVMGAGLAKQVRAKYPEVYEAYSRLCRLFGSRLLGECQMVPCGDGTLVANLFAQADYGTDGQKTDYLALESGLRRVRAFAERTGAAVAVPKGLGCGLAGGDWSRVSQILDDVFRDSPVVCQVVERPEPREPAAVPAAGVVRMPEVTVYTDGACSGNPGPGGWAAVLVAQSGQEKEMSGGMADTTNNQMELTAVIEALATLKTRCRVTLYSDSSYVCNAINKGWLASWKRNGWRKKGDPLKNVPLWQKLDGLLAGQEVTFVWVKGHAGNAYNERCDRMAVAECQKYK